MTDQLATSVTAYRETLLAQYSLRVLIDDRYAAARTRDEFADVAVLNTVAGQLWGETTHAFAFLPDATFTRVRNEVAREFGRVMVAAPKAQTERRNRTRRAA